MGKKLSEQPGRADEQYTAIGIIGDAADATWRMFTPIVGLTVAGVWFDRQFGTVPWAMVFGIVLGSCLAALLVYRMIVRINK